MSSTVPGDMARFVEEELAGESIRWAAQPDPRRQFLVAFHAGQRPHTDAKALGRFAPRVNAINFLVVHQILQRHVAAAARF